jgi:flagellar protein FlaJ
LAIILIGIIIPKTAASNRITGLKSEIPYASMYISVMASGGLSPYDSLMRLGHMGLLPNMQKEIERIQTIANSRGLDPISAMETAAKKISVNDYKELLLGYASTIRTGGDTNHYLYNQTENMFKNLSSRVKAIGENMGMLMETYTIIGILGVLGIFLIFVIGISLPQAGMNVSQGTFFLFSFIFMPFLSLVFIYAADTMQLSYPISNFRTYIPFLAALPIGVLLATQIVLPFFDKSFLVLYPAYNLIIQIRHLLGFAEGTEPAIGLAIVLIAVAIPGVIADSLYMGRDLSTQDGVTVFLRDLVETRKSGLSPERCFDVLTNRDYKGFTKHLKLINMKLNWGFPIRQIYQEFSEKVRNWLALINVYLLIDTLEVGGGSVDSLESLATFSEATKRLEDEKRSLLMPMVVVPYIGSAMLTATTVMFLSFFTGMAGQGVSVASVELYKILLTPLALHAFTLGLVTGKICSGRVSAGFKHGIFQSFVAMAGIWAVSHMNVGGMFIGG